MKILLACTTSNSVLTFRRPLIEKMTEKGHDVTVVCFDDLRREEIVSLGVGFECLPDSNRGTNPFKVFSLQRRYEKIIRRISPDALFAFMMKPNIFATLAAKRAGVKKIVCTVEGAGDVFAKNGLKWKLMRAYVCSKYRKAFRAARKVYFLNTDDESEFIRRKLVDGGKSEVIKGIGVDLKRFAFCPPEPSKRFLMTARMLEKKGVFEYCRAARKVKSLYPDAEFGYLGGEDELTLEDIKEFTDEKIVEYFGEQKDVRPYLKDCIAFVLPSKYREGLPMSIMEAESVGRAVITTDNVGCRDTVEDGVNGFKVKVGDADELAEKMIFIIENPDTAVEMGKASRRFAEENFDSEKINEKLVSEAQK